MAVGIIHRLEVVNVEQDEGQRLAQSSVKLCLLAQDTLHLAPVIEACQPVTPGKLAQGGFCAFAVSNITGDHAKHLPASISDAAVAHFNIDHRSIFANVLSFYCEPEQACRVAAQQARSSAFGLDNICKLQISQLVKAVPRSDWKAALASMKWPVAASTIKIASAFARPRPCSALLLLSVLHASYAIRRAFHLSTQQDLKAHQFRSS